MSQPPTLVSIDQWVSIEKGPPERAAFILGRRLA